jgi:hypothetical protein
MMRRRAVLLAGLVGLVVAVGGVGAGIQRAMGPARLQPFRSCGELVDYAKRQASRIAGSGGIVHPPGVVAAPAGTDGRAAADYSTTNVQEQGVDEPDLVKTDGSRIFAVAAGTLYAVDARGARPRLLGSLTLPSGWGHQLLLHGGRLLVISTLATLEPPVGRAAGPYLPSRTVLSEVDVHDPASMRIVRTLTIDGGYLAARLVGATARVVVGSMPRFPAVAGATPKAAGGEPSRGQVASSGLRNWLPFSVLKEARTGRTTTRALVQCRAVRRPLLFSGLGLVTVLTIDLEQGLPPVDSDAVLMGGGSVYASAGALYVATQRWLATPVVQPEPALSGMTTEIHEFDTSSPERTTYAASGSVTGYLLDQWSMSEYGGHLRVAATDLPSWVGPSPRQESESSVTVLGERGGKLVQVGQVGDLGRGERIYAVRFAGDVGYVVTFRQVDPLYTIDLSNPARPSVAGTLKIRGYSAYLHPIGKDLLLGVGRDASDEGRVLGTQLSLFDVSDLHRPARLDALSLGVGSSEVEYDPHAFLYWPARALAVLPVQISPDPQSPGRRPFVGAVAFRVGRTGIEQLGRITHPGTGQDDAPVRRSVVVGSRLFTVSDHGVRANDVATLAGVAWLPFA